MMNTKEIKTRLLKILGSDITAYIHALRFFYLFKFRYKPDPEVGVTSKVLKAGDVAIDVGANGGIWTYDLRRSVGGTGHVFAFEADPYYARATSLFFGMMRWKNITLFHFGLSDTDEEAPLRIVEPDGIRTTGGSFIDKNAAHEDQDVALVQLKTLDSLVGEYPLLTQTAVIKCDVEGFELFVFKGACKMIDGARPFVVLEVGHFDKHGYSNETLAGLFKKWNYEAFAMIGNKRLAPVGDDLRHPQALSVNRVFVPSEKRGVIADFIRT